MKNGCSTPDKCYGRASGVKPSAGEILELKLEWIGHGRHGAECSGDEPTSLASFMQVRRPYGAARGTAQSRAQSSLSSPPRCAADVDGDEGGPDPERDNAAAGYGVPPLSSALPSSPPPHPALSPPHPAPPPPQVDPLCLLYYPMRRECYWWSIVMLLRPTPIALAYIARDRGTGLLWGAADWRLVVIFYLMAYKVARARPSRARGGGGGAVVGR